MRFLVAEPGPNFSVQDVHRGWVEALRTLGNEVVEYPFSSTLTFYGAVLIEAGEGKFKRALTSEQANEMAIDRLCAALWKTRPDVLLAVSGFFLPSALLDTARMYGTKVVLLHTESPYQDGRQVELARHADLNLVNDPTNLDHFKAVAPAYYTPHAYRPDVHFPGPADPALACDLAFVGTAYPSRVEFFSRMNLTDLDVILAGNWQNLDEDSPLRQYIPHDVEDCLDNTDAVSIYRSAKVGINPYRREADEEHLSVGWAMGPREVEMAACGMFFLRDPRPESDEVFGMLPTFVSPEDASEQLRYWLTQDVQREALATKAREAIADRTFENHAKRLLAWLET